MHTEERRMEIAAWFSNKTETRQDRGARRTRPLARMTIRMMSIEHLNKTQEPTLEAGKQWNARAIIRTSSGSFFCFKNFDLLILIPFSAAERVRSKKISRFRRR